MITSPSAANLGALLVGLAAVIALPWWVPAASRVVRWLGSYARWRGQRGQALDEKSAVEFATTVDELLKECGGSQDEFNALIRVAVAAARSVGLCLARCDDDDGGFTANEWAEAAAMARDIEASGPSEAEIYMLARLGTLLADAGVATALAVYAAERVIRGKSASGKELALPVQRAGNGWSPPGPAIGRDPIGDVKTVKNRVHLDLTTSAADRDAEIGRLLALGASRVDIGQTGQESWTVLADPEGNEFCVVRPKDTLIG